jgi:hypothetical protein
MRVVPQAFSDRAGALISDAIASQIQCAHRSMIADTRKRRRRPDKRASAHRIQSYALSRSYRSTVAITATSSSSMPMNDAFNSVMEAWSNRLRTNALYTDLTDENVQAVMKQQQIKQSPLPEFRWCSLRRENSVKMELSLIDATHNKKCNQSEDKN